MLNCKMLRILVGYTEAWLVGKRYVNACQRQSSSVMLELRKIRESCGIWLSGKKALVFGKIVQKEVCISLCNFRQRKEDKFFCCEMKAPIPYVKM